MRAHVSALAIVVAAFLGPVVPTVAHANGAADAGGARAAGGVGAVGSGEPAALAREIETTYAKLGEELSTHACDEACRALASMRRAADRLCALEPGERCEQARARCDAATRQVREACPECAVAVGPPVHEQAAAAPPQKDVATVESRSTRGCASCTTTPGPAEGLDALVPIGLALAALARLRRGPKRRR